MAVPSAPTALAATRGDAAVTVTFTQAAASPAVTNYKYSLNGGAFVALSPADATSYITILGLSNGADYSITLKAVNGDGDSTESAAVVVMSKMTEMNSGKVPQPGGTPPGSAYVPPVRVPNIVGMTLTNGTAALTALGLVVGTNTGAPGVLNEILTQFPASNWALPAGGAVNVTVGNTP
jgi:hypothetical protein